MTHELIISGQRVDLSDAPSIALEWVSGLLDSFGSVQLSRSYTISLPKTARNRRILDDPENPAHDNTMVRRYLSARYYRNGIDLLGEAQAYLLDATGDAYEVGLLWNALPSLQGLSESKASLQALQGLPVLKWVGDNGRTPDYGAETDGAFFARYDSGLGDLTYPDVGTASHPAMRLLPLIDRILTGAGVPYVISSQKVREALNDMCILAAPSHRPNREMDELSGGTYTNVRVGQSADLGTILIVDTARTGWDAPLTGANMPAAIPVAGVDRFHVGLRLRASSAVAVSADACVLVTSGNAELARVDFVMNDSGSYDAVADLDLEVEQWSAIRLNVQGVPVGTAFTTTASGYTPVEMWRLREHIDIAYDNRFPIAENLPDIEQWEFVKSCLVMVGAVPVISRGTLLIMGYDEALDITDAYDWTDKILRVEKISQRIESWSQENAIVFADDKTQKIPDPTAILRIGDQTAQLRREVYKLPFAASQYSAAIHYGRDDEGELEDLDIQPRIMARRGDALTFRKDMSGDGLISTRYAELQRAIASPVRLTADMRLHEIDLATVDLRRSVYLRQFGQYFAILKIQTSDTDVCKVELIRIR